MYQNHLQENTAKSDYQLRHAYTSVKFYIGNFLLKLVEKIQV
jgi:hypothetical protein